MADNDSPLFKADLSEREIKSIRRARAARYNELLAAHETAAANGMTHKIWRTQGGDSVRASHTAANNQKVDIKESFRVGSTLLFLPSDPAAPFTETANCRCDVKYVREETLVHYRLKDSTVRLNNFTRSKVNELANKFYSRKQKDITITDGYRTPREQAGRMFTDAQANRITSRYRQYAAGKAVQEAYDQAVALDQTRDEILAAMSQVISGQIDSGTYISDHLRNNAVDIRSRDMDSGEKDTFREIADKIAQKTLLEFPGGQREHWHLEF